jgi:hypothetical protein
MIACDDNAYLQMVSANAEQDQQQVNHTPAQTDCTATQVYYGCGEWRR